MIFVTVGSVQSFDRLVQAVDEWAGRQTTTVEVFAQIADGTYVPRNFESAPHLEPGEYRKIFEDASLIVAHAGMGTIITALDLGKPLVVLPRLGRLRETRNDHQVATVDRFRDRNLIHVAETEDQVGTRLDEFVSGDLVKEPGEAHERSPRTVQLIEFVNQFVRGRDPLDPASGIKQQS